MLAASAAACWVASPVFLFAASLNDGISFGMSIAIALLGTLTVGWLLAILQGLLPIAVFGALMTVLAHRVPVARSIPVWIATGAASGALLSRSPWMIFFEDPEIIPAYSATGAACALTYLLLVRKAWWCAGKAAP